MERLRSLWLDLPLAHKGIIVATLPVVTLLLAAIPTVLNELNSARVLEARERSHTAKENAQAIIRHMQEAELRMLGFLLSKDSTQYRLFQAANRDAAEALTITDTLITDSLARVTFNSVRNRVVQMRAALQYDIEVNLNRTPPPEYYEQMLLQERRTTAALRLAVDSLIDAEARVIDEQVTRLESNRRTRLYFSSLFVVVGLVASGLSAVLFVSGIATRVDRLQDSATRTEWSGQHSTQVSGEDELGQLAQAIEENRRDAARIADRLRVAITGARIEVIEVHPERDSLTFIGSGNVFRRMGYTPDAVPKTLTQFLENVHDEDRVRVAEAITSSPAGVEYEVEFRLRAKDESWHWMDLRGAAARTSASTVATNGHRPAAVGVLLDVTERKQAEEQVREALTVADRANRAKSDFVSRMSHELRTPLNAVLGFAQLLEIDELTPDQRESVAHILRGGRYLLDLINEVLDLARIEAGRFAMSIETVSMREVVGAVVALIGPQAAEFGVRLYFPPPGFNCFASADRHRLKQVLLNLLSNAIKYNRRGGSVEISLERNDTMVRVLVKDTGPGIADAEINRLFQPFERLDAAKSGVEGTGLGLALSRSIVEAMGGHISVESVPGSGSTFIVELPKAEPTEDEIDTATYEAPARQMTIVYVEDNQANVRLVERVVGRRPTMRLVSVGEGDRAHDLVRKERPDLVLLDVNLPGLPGDAVLEQLRNDPQTQHIPVAILSADATAAQIAKMRSLGAQHYFTKPIDVTRLLELFDDVAAGRFADGRS